MDPYKRDIELQRRSPIAFAQPEANGNSHSILVLDNNDESDILIKSSKNSWSFTKFASYIQNLFTLKFSMIFVIIVISFILYLKTLRGCSSDAEMLCVGEMVPLIPRFCFYMFIVGLIIDGIIYLSLKKVLQKECGYLALFEIIIIVAISNGHSFQSHGGYNRLFFIVALILNLITINLIGLLYKIFTKHPKVVGSLVIGLGFVLYLLIFVYWFGSSCANWEKGFKNTHITKEFCELPQPQTCFYDLTSNWFDLSSLLNKNDCSKVKNDIPLLQEDADFVAYPKTQFFSRQEKYFEAYQKTILAQMKKVSETQIYEEGHEVVLDQRNNYKNIMINIFPNQTLIKRSTDILALNGTTSKPQNILMIFIDSVSRQHFRRKLPKTHKWLDNYYQNKTSHLESFQFFKYHTSAAHTTPNMMKIFYGTTYENASLSYPLSLKFKENGYITAKSNNFCGSTYFDISESEAELEKLNMESFDHENTAMFCDPNYQKTGEDGSYGYMEGSFAMVRRCLYGKDTHEHVLDYGNKFWRSYKDQHKVLEVGFMDGHEPSSELLQYLDRPLYNFLSDLEKDNLLNDTAIVFYADHGHHVNIFYHLFQLNDLQYELRLPMIFLILPRNLADKYGDQIRSHEQNLIAAYDIYNTFSFLGGSQDMHPEGWNLLKTNYTQRCFIDVGLEEDFCICKCK